MDAQTQNPAPENERANDGIFKAGLGQLTTGLNEWISLLGGPDPAIFKSPPAFEWGRLVRSIVIVLSFSGAVLGTALIVIRDNVSGIVFQKFPAALLLGGALVAVGYTFIARLFGVEISLRDAFFAILLLTLPWLPLTIALYVGVEATRWPWMALVWIIWVVLAPLSIVRNICRGFGLVIPECGKLRLYLSVIVPSLLFASAVLFVWLFADFPAAVTK